MASGNTLLEFSPLANEPPASNYATIDSRNQNLVLDFDGAADEEAVFSGILPRLYSGGGITAYLWIAFTSATSGTSRWQGAFERTQDGVGTLASDSFAAFNSAGLAAPGTAGIVAVCTITFANGSELDSLAAGERFRFKVRRDADGTSGTDDITTDAELVAIELKET